MAFEFVFENYGSMNFPYYSNIKSKQPIPISPNEYNNVKFNYASLYGSNITIPSSFKGVGGDSIPENVVLYAIKIKDTDIFFRWDSQPNDDQVGNINFYVSDSLSFNSGKLIRARKGLGGYDICIGLFDNKYYGIFYFVEAFGGYIHFDGIDISTLEFVGKVTSPEFGDPSSNEGYTGGSFDNTSEEIELPITPNVGVTKVGFINVYKTTAGSLDTLGDELFPNFTPPEPIPTTEEDNLIYVLRNGINNLASNLTILASMFVNSNLINYVIDCHVIPVSPPTNENLENIKIGFREFTPKARKVLSDYVDFDCGGIVVEEYYNNFIDYVGTRAQLFLPFIGFVPLANEFFQDGKIQIKYRFNIIDGSFMCYVMSSSSKSQLKDSIIAQYGGNACVHIPITGENYSNMVSGLIGAVPIGNKNINGAAISNSALATLQNKPPLEGSNGYNTTSSFLSVRCPYLLIERQVSNFSESFPNENGLPCNITSQLDNNNGYFEVDNIILDSISCFDEERLEIERLLKSGVFR